MMFADMDESLRHLGIGELSIGKQIKRLAGHFYARLRALDHALGTVPAASLAPMLRTNVYHGGIAPGARQLDALAGYVVAAERGLRGQEARICSPAKRDGQVPRTEQCSALRETSRYMIYHKEA